MIDLGRRIRLGIVTPSGVAYHVMCWRRRGLALEQKLFACSRPVQATMYFLKNGLHDEEREGKRFA